jgi:hypothetical protein
MSTNDSSREGAEYKDIPDFSSYTCTSLMIRLKMLLKNIEPGTPVECIVRRDQTDTIDVPFSRSGYNVKIRRIETNRYHVSLTEKVSGKHKAE